MRVNEQGAIELDNGLIIQPWYLEGADWKEYDLSECGLTEEEVTEAKALMTDSVKATFTQIYGAPDPLS